MRVFKFVLVGNSATGKSSLIRRYVNNEFQHGFVTTLGVDFCVKTIEDGNYRVQIWDTAGQERYRAIGSAYYRGATVVAIIYDVTNMASYEAATGQWFDECRTKMGKHTVVWLIGNKVDVMAERVVSSTDAAAWAMAHGVFFSETSAKLEADAEQGVNRCFQAMVETAAAQQQEPPPNNPIEVGASSEGRSARHNTCC